MKYLQEILKKSRHFENIRTKEIKNVPEECCTALYIFEIFLFCRNVQRQTALENQFFMQSVMPLTEYDAE